MVMDNTVNRPMRSLWAGERCGNSGARISSLRLTEAGRSWLSAVLMIAAMMAESANPASQGLKNNSIIFSVRSSLRVAALPRYHGRAAKPMANRP